MRWDFWQRAGLFLRPDVRVLFVGRRKDPRFPLEKADGPFDLVLYHHVPYDLQEVHGLLKPGGFFLTEQVGGEPIDYNLENQVPLFKEAGFRVVHADQGYGYTEEGIDHRFIITAGRRKAP